MSGAAQPYKLLRQSPKAFKWKKTLTIKSFHLEKNNRYVTKILNNKNKYFFLIKKKILETQQKSRFLETDWLIVIHSMLVLIYLAFNYFFNYFYYMLCVRKKVIY